MSDVHKNLVVATHNTGKYEQFYRLLTPYGYCPEMLEKNIPVAEETGDSFVENALLKARFYAQYYPNQPILADDSGLEIHALNGQPGIFSARFSGESASDALNRAKVLRLMQPYSHDRTARFTCALVYLRHKNDPSPITALGYWQGEIALSETGLNGFGYDSIFWLPEQQCTAACLSVDLKNTLCHRTMALKQLLEKLQE